MVDTGGDAIPSAMQLIAGRTVQEHNLRKGRKGAFWEDRHHATAVQTGDHLARCMVYIDMNMVRAGMTIRGSGPTGDTPRSSARPGGMR